MTDHRDDTTNGPASAAQLRGTPGLSSLAAGPAQLVDALRQLSTLLLLTAEEADNIVAALTGEPPDNGPYAEPVRTGHRTDSAPDTRADNERPKLTVVRLVDEPPCPASADVSADIPPSYVRDVEPRPNGRWRGRVRWLDSQTKRYRSRSKNFDAPAAAWSWAERWTPNGDEH